MVMFICLNLNYNTASKLNNSFTRKCYKVGRPVGTSCILIEWATIRALWIRVCPKMEQPMAIKIWDTNHFEYLDVIRFSDQGPAGTPCSSSSLAASCCCANSCFWFGGLEWLRAGRYSMENLPVFNMWKTQVQNQHIIAQRRVSKLQRRVPAIIRNKTRTQHINVY